MRDMALAAGLVCLVATRAAGANEPAACSAASAGRLSMQAKVRCECQYVSASALAGTEGGYRWDCGILRARNNQDVPATSNPYPYPLPPGLSIGRRRR